MLKDTIQDVLYELSQSTIAKVISVVAIAIGIFIGFILLSGASEEKICITELKGKYIDGICTIDDDSYARNIIIVAGNTANSPKPQISEDGEVYKYIKNSIMQNQKNKVNIKIVSAAENKSSKTIKMEEISSKSVSALKKTIESTTQKINEAISEAPTGNGATYFEAIAKAGRAAASYKNNDESIVIVIGSGLSDGGVLNFAEYDLLSKDATKIIDALNKEYLLDGDYLNGVNILWLGIGQTIDPQKELPPSDIEKLKNIYEKAFRKLGADIEFDDSILKSDAIINNKYTVKTTPINGGNPCEIMYTFLNSELTFVADSHQFLDENKAGSVLANVIAEAKTCPNKKVIITGYMAAGNCSGKPSKPFLAKDRAETVSNFLKNYGVTNSIEVIDGGVFEQSKSECDGNDWKPELADYRRKVTIEFK